MSTLCTSCCHDSSLLAAIKIIIRKDPRNKPLRSPRQPRRRNNSLTFNGLRFKIFVFYNSQQMSRTIKNLQSDDGFLINSFDLFMNASDFTCSDFGFFSKLVWRSFSDSVTKFSCTTHNSINYAASDCKLNFNFYSFDTKRSAASLKHKFLAMLTNMLFCSIANHPNPQISPLQS